MLSCFVPSLPPAVRALVRARLDERRALRAWAADASSAALAAALLSAAGPRWRELDLLVYGAPLRPGVVSAAALAGLGPGARRRFFTPAEGGFRPRPVLAALCRGAAPATAGSFGLISCSRDASTERRRLLGAALAPGGLLLCGSRCRPAPLAAPAPRRDPLADALFTVAGEAVLVIDAASGRIRECNAAAERLYGWSRAELEGKAAEQLSAPPGASRRARGERRSEARLSLPHHRRKDGTLFPVQLSAASLVKDGRPARLWLVRDASAALRAAALEASRARDGARDAYLDELVHELRNPMAIISGSAEVLREGSSAPESERLLLSIESQTRRMAVMVDRLLDLGAAGAAQRVLRPQAVELSKALAELVWGYEPLAKRRGLSLRLDAPAGLRALADPGDLPHLFGNLLDNAVKYGRRGGAVHVTARAEGGEAAVSVRDEGEGLAPEELPRVFERYFRGEGAGGAKGAGLGLSIVAALAAANGGRASAENHPAGGALFTVRLPLAPEAS